MGHGVPATWAASSSSLLGRKTARSGIGVLNLHYQTAAESERASQRLSTRLLEERRRVSPSSPRLARCLFPGRRPRLSHLLGAA
ncbi:unnamed protein product [Lampetra fluviatilis]